MPKITIKFAKDLEGHYESFQDHFGIRFHRWLPDGEKDAIDLDTIYPDTKIKLWFKRFGFDERGRIVFNDERKEVDPDLMNKQGSLESGPLFGKIESFKINNEELQVLKENKIGDKIYQNLGKRIIEIIDPTLIKFFYILRIHYGQYWLPEFKKFNSEKESIGYHLRFLWMEWSSDNGKNWEELEPDNEYPVTTVEMSSPESFQKLITKTDWEKLPDILKEEHSESLASYTLARTHQYINEGDLKRAFFEGITSIELAIEKFIQNRIKNNHIPKKNIKRFLNRSITIRLVLLATIMDISKEDIENAVTAIKWRNKIVHQGWEPEFYAARKNLFSLLQVTSKFLQGPNFKFPSAGGNAIMPAEAWEKVYKKSSFSFHT